MISYVYHENIKAITEIQDALDIRFEVFVEEQKVPAEEEIDEYDMTAIHIIMYQDSKPIGTLRLLESHDQYKIGRFAILKGFRGNGNGKALFQEGINKYESLGVKKIYIHAQSYLIKFYESFGFKVNGAMFLECGIEHNEMILEFN